MLRGDEAEIALRENVPDLLILDWMLKPGVSGIELCRRLRQWPETERLPIIMLDGTWRGKRTCSRPERRCGDYVVKPFSTPELLARVSGDVAPVESEHSFARAESGRPGSRPPTAGRVYRKEKGSSSRTNGIPPARIFHDVARSRLHVASFWMAFGGLTSMSTTARWTSMSDGCARRSMSVVRSIRSAPFGVRVILRVTAAVISASGTELVRPTTVLVAGRLFGDPACKVRIVLARSALQQPETGLKSMISRDITNLLSKLTKSNGTGLEAEIAEDLKHHECVCKKYKQSLN